MNTNQIPADVREKIDPVKYSESQNYKEIPVDIHIPQIANNNKEIKAVRKAYRNGAEFGYRLAIPEIEGLKADNYSLKESYQSVLQANDEIQSDCYKLEAEIFRLKSELQSAQEEIQKLKEQIEFNKIS